MLEMGLARKREGVQDSKSGRSQPRGVGLERSALSGRCERRPWECERSKVR